MPSSAQRQLADVSRDVFLALGRLTGTVASPLVRDTIADLVRTMNCYYSNLIEGHKTLPRDIERALRPDAPSGRRQEENHRLAEAHIQTEMAMRERIRSEDVDVYAPEFIGWIHEDFHRRLPPRMHVAHTKSGKEYRIHPGRFRSFMVDAGHHTPPDDQALPAFMERFRAFYGSGEILATHQLIAIAAAHHRLAWIHPFGDGNGRVARLHSQALLTHHGLSGDGLWTLSRGLARARDPYFAALQTADRARENDVDGRGHLSDKGLADFCTFFLTIMLDQIQFMDKLLNLAGLRERIERYIMVDATDVKKHRRDLARVVSALAVEGEFPRERVMELTGKGMTTAASITKLGLSEGYFASPSPKGKLRIAFPPKALPAYFPNLFIDLPMA